MIFRCKPFSLIIFLLIYSAVFSKGFAEENSKSLRWIDNSNHLHREIDLNSGLYRLEQRPGVWKNAGNIKLIHVDELSFPKDFENKNIHYHAIKDGILFKIPGTGMVFIFDKSKSELKRIDNTYFRGFNFHSFSFYKNDTLFSIGGEGFWSTNSTLIYFDKNNLEWDKVPSNNKGPNSIEWDFGGYESKLNTFYALEGREEFKSNDFDQKSLFSLDLSTMTWKELGRMNTTYFSNPTQISIFKFWLGDFFLYLDGFHTSVFLLDPIHNKVLKFEGKYAQSKIGSKEVFRDKDYIYFYKESSNGNSLDSMHVKTFLKDAVEIGPMYHQASVIPWKYTIYVIAVLLGLLSVFLFIQKKKFQQLIKNLDKPADFNELPPHLLHVLKYFKEKGKGELISTNEMNDLLQIKSNSFESTRQQRAKDLKALNDFFLLNYSIPQAIIRTNSEKDKRITYYGLDEKAHRVI